jgi:hypothetical protein
MDPASQKDIPIAAAVRRAREGSKRHAYALVLIHVEPGI